MTKLQFGGVEVELDQHNRLLIYDGIVFTFGVLSALTQSTPQGCTLRLERKDRYMLAHQHVEFSHRILQMNEMYKLPTPDRPTIPPDTIDRLVKFRRTLQKEIEEIDDIAVDAWGKFDPVDVAVAIADVLGDIIVYCRSEAMKYGIPLEEVLDIIMDSNQSKLGADGEPIYDENGKFLKGPNYWKPEPKIRQLLEEKLK